jgi:alpha-L-fucosidase
VTAGYSSPAGEGRSGPLPTKYEPTWESLKGYQVPTWYEDAKFGIFIHWGVYAVPAYDNEWYPRNMYIKGSDVYNYHREHYGPQSTFGYKDFIHSLTAERWNPDRWVELFRQAGAKYVVPVGEHHDGFPMYDCSFTDWKAAKMGPRRDIVGELAESVRRQGLKLGVSSHRAFNWSYYTYDKNFDTSNPKYSGLYGTPHAPTPLISDRPGELRQTAPKAFLDDWYRRTTEIVDRYQPDLMWFDFGFEAPEYEPYRKRFAAHYYNRAEDWGKGVVVNYKHQAYPEDVAVLDIERGLLDSIRPRIWQTDTSVSWKSWGYIRDDSFKSADELVDELIDIVSKHGCLLLNVGPRPDGTIPEEAERVFREMGQWLEVNGEAIYGTRPWSVYGEGPTRAAGGYFREKSRRPYTPQDIRFTTKQGTLYAICLAWPGRELRIKSLGSESRRLPEGISAVQLLGIEDKLDWTRSADSLTITVPDKKPCDNAYTFKIVLRA